MGLVAEGGGLSVGDTAGYPNSEINLCLKKKLSETTALGEAGLINTKGGGDLL